jgi:hypothetical protein
LHALELYTPFTRPAGGDDRPRTTHEKHAPKHVGKPGSALEQPSQAVLVKGAQFRQRVVLGGLLGGRCRPNRHHGFPHIRSDPTALVGCFALSHLRPVPIDDRIHIGQRQRLQLGALRFRKSFAEVIDIQYRVCLKIYIQVSLAETRPDGLEHEAEDDGVRRA